MDSRSGFTLAETMITMIVLGVLAALTIPTVINNSKMQEYRAGYQKAINVLNNAYGEYYETGRVKVDLFETKTRDVVNCPEGTSLTHFLGFTFCYGGGLNIEPVTTQEEYQEKVGEKMVDPVSIGEDGMTSNAELMKNIFAQRLSMIKTTTVASDLATPIAGCPTSGTVTYFYTQDGLRYCMQYDKSSGINETYAENTYGVIWVDTNGEKAPNRKSTSITKLGDTFPIIIMKDRFIPGHPTNTADSTLAQQIYFGDKSKRE